MAGIYVEILGNATQFKKELDGAVAATATANSGFQKFGKVAGVVGLALAGTLAFGLDKSVKAAINAQASTARLSTALNTVHESYKKLEPQILANEAAGRKLGITDEDTRVSLGSLVIATGSLGKAMKEESVAIDLARFKHVDLATATRALAMAQTGSSRALKQLGISVVPVTTQMDALRNSNMKTGTEEYRHAEAVAKLSDKLATNQKIIATVTEKVHGMGPAFAGTAAGGVQQLHAQLDHLEVKIGTGLLPALRAVVSKLTEFADFLGKHTTLAKALAIGLGVLAGSLLAVAAAGAIADLALSPILLPVAAVTVGIAALSFVVYKLVSDFRANWPLLLPIVLGPLGAIIAAVIHWHSQIAGAFEAAWNTVKGVTMAGVNAVVGAIRGAVGAALGAAGAVGHAIVSGLKSGLAAIVGAVTGAFGKVWSAVKGFVGEALAVGAQIGAAIMHGIASGIKGAVGAAVGAVKAAGSSVLGAAKGFLGIHSPSLVFAREVGVPMMEGIAQGIAAGQLKVHSALLAGVQNAKAGVDNFVATTGVANMTAQGSILAKALAGGFSGGLSGAALVNAPAPSFAGLTGAALVNAPAGSSPTTVVVHVGTVIGNDLEAAGKQLAEPVRRELLRIQGRNGGLGFAT